MDKIDKPSESALELQTAKLLAGLLHAILEEQRCKAAVIKAPEAQDVQTVWADAKGALWCMRSMAMDLQYGFARERGFSGYFLEQLNKRYAEAQEAHFIVGRTCASDEKKADAEQAEQQYPYKLCGGCTDAGITEDKNGDLVTVRREDYEEPECPKGPQTKAQRLREVCQAKIEEIGQIGAQLEATVQQKLEHYKTVTLAAMIAEHGREALEYLSVKDYIRRAEVDISDCQNAKRYAYNIFEFGWPEFTEGDLKSILETEKQLHELAERIHGIEKLPEEVASLTDADSGYHIGS